MEENKVMEQDVETREVVDTIIPKSEQVSSIDLYPEDTERIEDSDGMSFGGLIVGLAIGGAVAVFTNKDKIANFVSREARAKRKYDKAKAYVEAYDKALIEEKHRAANPYVNPKPEETGKKNKK